MRSLNLANAVGIVLYEGLRQLGLQAPPRLTFADTVPPAVTAEEDEEDEDEVNGNVPGAAERIGGKPAVALGAKPSGPAGAKRRGRGRGRGRGTPGGRPKSA
jgi:hypothetical protein